jgi:4-amino-4-deoxy-L-arabinose transferase-like glycosyltransferase
MLLLTLLLGFVLYSLGSRMGGQWGGLLCLTAFVSMPAFIAFGPLVITDIAITLFWVLAVWQLPEMWRSPSRWTIIKLGLTLAAAFLSKFSSGLLFFVFIALALSLRWRGVLEQPTEKLARRAWRRRAWWNMLKATVWAALFVYIFYFVFSWGQPTDSFNMIPHFPASPLLRRVLMPAWLYLGGIAMFAVSASSRPTYILGHAYSHGVWFYFPTLFVLKSPLTFLLLLLLAIAIAVVLKRRSAVRAAWGNGIAMARSVGFAGGFCSCVHAEPSRSQHPSFSDRNRSADSPACPAAAHVAVAATLQLERRPAR